MPKKPEYIKTPGFVIEVPKDRRKGFFVAPKAPLVYWAFKNRPRVFISEKLIFTFGGKPVAEALVAKVEGPGKGEGEFKTWHKVYWKPVTFKRFRIAGDPSVYRLTAVDHDLETDSGETYWAGEGNAASGILPVCPQKGTVCLAWRSQYVQSPDCWGTIGGAVQSGKSPQGSAKAELAEETGYTGGINLIPAYVFTDGGFTYHNYIGVVGSEFSFSPKPLSKEEYMVLKSRLRPNQYHQLVPGWETDHIEWVKYETVLDDMNENPEDYHPGMLKLFKHSKDAIERALGKKEEPQQEPQQEKEAGNMLPTSQPPDVRILPCPSGKKKYFDKATVLMKARGIQGTEAMAYQCPKCHWWHMTSKPQHGPNPTYKNSAEQIEMFPSSQDAKFRQWFDGSKVVDQQGRPMPVYHGTRSSVDFDTFAVDGPPQVENSYEGETTSSGSGWDPTAYMGAHFAEESRVANQFAQGEGWTKSRYEGEAEAPRIIQVFLRITNPKDFGTESNLHNYIYQGKITDDDVLGIGCRVETGYNPWEGDDDENVQKEIEQYYQKYENDQSFRAKENEYLMQQYRPMDMEDDMLRNAAYELAMQARHRLEQSGVDGIRYKNEVEGGHAWIAFAPQQIKSVNSQFNPQDQRFIASKTADALKAWFDGSKVVDQSGNPRVVYHGSKSKWLTQFDLSQEGRGIHGGTKWGAIWFTSSAENAEEYADTPEGKAEADLDEIAAYGNDPFYAAVYDVNGESIFQVGPYPTEEEAERQGLAEAREYNKRLQENTNINAVYLKITNPYITDKVPRDAEFKAAKQGGHDGIIAYDVVDGYTASDIFVIFDPKQAKSATRNVGTYDPNSTSLTADWKRNVLLPAALTLGLGSPSVAPSEITQQQKVQMQRDREADAEKLREEQIDKLIEAISRAEGAKPERNNPGNIADFTTGEIKTFNSLEEGRDALADQLNRIADGVHPFIKPEMTLREAGLIYSNGDPNWARNVSLIMHVPQNTKIGDIIKGVTQRADTGEQPSGRTGAWLKKAAGFAFKTFQKLWHVGSMNVKDKGNDSLEGAGLSVSVHPEEWQEIARIGGDLWELTKKGNKFLNFHRLSPSQRKGIAQWGLQSGYVENVSVWRASWYDDEADDTRFSDFEDEQEARDEAAEVGGEVAQVDNELKGTAKLQQRSNNPGANSTILAFDLLVTVYAEEELDCDGVWWADNLDVPNLSAPRGVIFPGKLSSWTAKKVRTASLSYKRDKHGILWALDAELSLTPVSIPDELPENERDAFAIAKLKEQTVMADSLRKKLKGSWKHVPTTDEWINRAKVFLKEKWEQRHKELGREGIPTDLKGACKFASMFAQKLFGGRMVGTAEHQVLKHVNRIIDLTDIYNPNTFTHDKEFWMNPEHEESLKSCEPRVNQWVDEFYEKYWQDAYFRAANSQ